MTSAVQIAILLYDRFTTLDAVGPYEVLSRLPDTRVIFTAARPGPVTADTGMLSLVAEAAIADVPHPDIVLVPGGPGQEQMIEYDPQPPYQAGSPGKAPADLVASMRLRSRHRADQPATS